MTPLIPAKPQTPAVMKKGRWENKQINQVLPEMPRNAEVALGEREHYEEMSQERV